MQSQAQILAHLPQHIRPLHQIAERTYSAWTAQLPRPRLFYMPVWGEARLALA